MIRWLDMDKEIFAVVLCLMGSAFFSASETALTGLPISRLKALRTKNRGLTRAGLDRWAHDPQGLLISILIGNNLVNVLASALATRIAYQLSEVAGLALVVGVMTLVILIFGEITPKTLAQIHAEKLSVLVAPILFLIDYVLRPVSWLLSLLTKILPKPSVDDAPVNEEDLRFMVRLAQRHSLLPTDARLMIESVLKFQNTLAREIMVPRPRVAMVDVTWSNEAVRAFVAEQIHSRFPVVDGAPDKLVGVLHSRQLLRLGANQPWQKIVTNPLFIPGGKAVPALLHEMRDTGQHLAIVLDEFGGLSGVVSIEDALELLVGEIEDEFDREVPSNIIESEDGWLVPGHLGIRRLERLFERDISTPDGVDSVGGLASALSEGFEVGDVLETEGLIITIDEITEGRASRVHVKAKDAAVS